MKRFLRIAAAGLLPAAVIFWAAAGGNRGWTKTSVPKKTMDEVTGIEGTTFEKGFVPGIDFLGVAALGAGVLASVSLLIGNKNTGVRPNPQ